VPTRFLHEHSRPPRNASFTDPPVFLSSPPQKQPVAQDTYAPGWWFSRDSCLLFARILPLSCALRWVSKRPRLCGLGLEVVYDPHVCLALTGSLFLTPVSADLTSFFFRFVRCPPEARSLEHASSVPRFSAFAFLSRARSPPANFFFPPCEDGYLVLFLLTGGVGLRRAQDLCFPCLFFLFQPSGSSVVDSFPFLFSTAFFFPLICYLLYFERRFFPPSFSGRTFIKLPRPLAAAA